jgi:hypothetical protein
VNAKGGTFRGTNDFAKNAKGGNHRTHRICATPYLAPMFLAPMFAAWSSALVVLTNQMG